MHTTQTQYRFAVVSGTGSTAHALTARLRSNGWTTASSDQPSPEVDGLVYDPGLLDEPERVRAGAVVEEFLDTVEELRPRLRSSSNGGARIVVLSSRDGLGRPSSPLLAAASGALVSAARSLALALAPEGVTVNVVAALPSRSTSPHPDAQDVGTTRHELSELTPERTTIADIAGAVEFFLHPRSGYLTGQVLYCCGGASLLSSLSV